MQEDFYSADLGNTQPNLSLLDNLGQSSCLSGLRGSSLQNGADIPLLSEMPGALQMQELPPCYHQDFQRHESSRAVETIFESTYSTIFLAPLINQSHPPPATLHRPLTKGGEEVLSDAG